MSDVGLELRLLGPLEVLRGGSPVDLPPSRKARALLGYLVATGRPQTRGALCDLFWDDVNDPRAGLRWALSRLRTVVDGDDRPRILTRRDLVELRLDGADVDLQRLHAVLEADADELPVGDLEAASRSFRGTFLEGLDLPGCHRYQVWCMGVRERVRGQRLTLQDALIARLGDDPARALDHALARIDLDPFQEDAYIGAMDILAELGRRDRAMELYERCRRMLAEELEVPPSPELEAARRRIESSTGPRPRASAHSSEEGRTRDLAEALTRLPDPEHLPPPRDDEPPLRGRQAERDSLRALVHDGGVRGGSAVTLLSGEPGIGKTRLLRELVQEVRAAGGWVVSGPVLETEGIRPYGPWIDLLRGLPDAVMPKDSARSLGALVGGREPRDEAEAPVERTQLFDAVADLLRGMAEASSPGAVILDDVQWLDSSSAALLHYLVRTLDSSPIAFGLAARTTELEPGSVTARVLRTLDADGRLRHLALERFGEDDTRALVRDVDLALDPARVFAASEGNPLFTLALARSLSEGIESPPRSIEEELDRRLDRLERGPLALLPWAAALGRAFDVPALVRVVDRPTHEIVDAIDVLESQGILRPTGTDRYDFTHALLRDAAYRRVSEPARRAIHRSIAQALDGADPDGGGAAGAVAHQAELGGLHELAARRYAQAAHASLWVFAFDEAAQLVQRGLAQAGRLPDAAGATAEMELLRVYALRSMDERRPDGLEDRVRRLTDRAAELGLLETVAVGHAILMELEYQRGAFSRAEESSLRSAEAGRDASPPVAIRALAETAACCLILDRAPEDARRLADEAFRLAEEHEVKMDVIPLAKALLAHHDGELDQATRAFEAVIRLGRQARDRWWECPAMTRLVMVELDRPDPERALARAREAVELAVRMDDEAEAAFAQGLEAVAALEVAASAGAAEGELDAVDAALEALHRVDSLWMTAHVQAYAAEAELRRDRPDRARIRARSVLEAGRTLQRPALQAMGRGLLAHASALGGQTSEARRHLGAPEVTDPSHRLSHRARTVVDRARAMLE
jgi:DNA-binding SARP family transcriptional activator/tetratricopeptide (TPR) repeat protein